MEGSSSELYPQLSLKYFANLRSISKLFSKIWQVQTALVKYISRTEWVKHDWVKGRKACAVQYGARPIDNYQGKKAIALFLVIHSYSSKLCQLFSQRCENQQTLSGFPRGRSLPFQENPCILWGKHFFLKKALVL